MESASRYIRLNNHLEMPLLGFGTHQLKGQECVEAVWSAVQAGYTLFDTASCYRNEEDIQKGLESARRQDLFITSKIAPT